MVPMKRSANSVLLSVGLLLATACDRAAGAAGVVRQKAIRLPPLAVVLEEDDTGDTWRIPGDRATIEPLSFSLTSTFAIHNFQVRLR